jgi:hypothetical protein
MKKYDSNVFSPQIHRYSLAFKEISADTPEILDVGGYISRGALLHNFFSAFTYKSINIGSAWYNEQSDYIYEGDTLPFEDSAVEYTISIDTLEHMEKKRRESFIDEIVRVASKKAIIVTPFCSDNEVINETYLLNICRKYNIEAIPSLKEHESFGLPLYEDLQYVSQKYEGKIKLATPKKTYWSIQTSMLWNTVALQGRSYDINKKLQCLQEEILDLNPTPLDISDAYRCVLIIDRKVNK